LKIQNASSQTPLAGVEPAGRPAAGAAPAAGAGSRNTVELSPAARQLSNLQNSGNDVDVERVNALRAAIASGQLALDPGRIADKIIASARDLLK
jgi:negative regulator of flagellin synthesis FlgM